MEEILKEYININNNLLKKEDILMTGFRDNLYSFTSYIDEVYIYIEDGFKIINLNKDYSFDIIVKGNFRILSCLDIKLTQKIEVTEFTVRFYNLCKNYILEELKKGNKNIKDDLDYVDYDTEIIKINNNKIIDFINNNIKKEI